MAVGSGGLVGFALGLVGGGGSILATPLLLYAVGIAQPHIAIGTGALAVSVNAYANLIGQGRRVPIAWRRMGGYDDRSRSADAHGAGRPVGIRA